jgi:LysM domain-containing protein
MFGRALDVEQVFGHTRRMHRTRVRRRRLAAVGVLGVGLWVGVPAAANALHGGGEIEHAPTARYVVRPGDTLWAIATAAAPERDPREVVGLIGSVNDLEGGEIVPGQVLVVPAG